MNFADSFFWELVFQFLESKDLVAVAGVCYSWWILVFRGSCRKLITSKVRELDIADTKNFYHKLPADVCSYLQPKFEWNNNLIREFFFTCDGCKTSQGSGDRKMREHLRGCYLPRQRLLAEPGKCNHFVQHAIRSSGYLMFVLV